MVKLIAGIGASPNDTWFVTTLPGAAQARPTVATAWLFTVVPGHTVATVPLIVNVKLMLGMRLTPPADHTNMVPDPASYRVAEVNPAGCSVAIVHAGM